MTRVIKIEKCSDCPNCDHEGAFGAVAYIPRCKAAHKRLPYVACEDERRPGRLYASQKPGIPNWCPLEVYPPK